MQDQRQHFAYFISIVAREFDLNYSIMNRVEDVFNDHDGVREKDRLLTSLQRH